MKILKLRKVKTPERGTPGSAGIDFYIPDDMEWESYTVHVGESALIPSGIKAEIPPGFVLVAFTKSGQAVRNNIMIASGVIDSDYQGEIGLHVFNRGKKPITLMRGEKLLQYLLLPVSMEAIEEVGSDQIHTTKTQRGEGGYGSTGNGK